MQIAPLVTYAFCSYDGTDEEVKKHLKKVSDLGPEIVCASRVAKGCMLYCNGKYYEQKAVPIEKVVDTMGAGDSYFSAFLCSLLETSKEGKIVEGTDEEMAKRLQTAMGKGAVFAAKVCALEGAFGYGVPILGKTTV